MGKKVVKYSLLIFAPIIVLLCVLWGLSLRAVPVAHAATPGFVEGYATKIEGPYDGTEKTVSLTFSESGATYQWYKKAEEIGGSDTLLEGKTGTAIIVKTSADNGVYYCEASYGGNAYFSDYVTVNISHAELIVDIMDEEVFYGDPNSPLRYELQTALRPGDKESDLGITVLRESGRDAGTYAITGTYTPNDKYAVRFLDGEYVIKKRNVKIEVATMTSTYGEELKPLKCEATADSTFARGESVDNLNITLTKEAGLDAGTYAIDATYDNDNYAVTFTKATYVIQPKKVGGRLLGVNGLTYSGRTPEIGFEFIGEIPEGTKATISYDKAVKNAGDYVAYVSVGNKNYALDNGGIYPFSVKKAPLKIKLNDVAYRVFMAPTFTYTGFVDGEDENILDTLPTAEMPTAAGEHFIYPVGATAKNYEIEYVYGVVSVYEKGVYTEGVTLEGDFMPNAFLEATVVDGKSVKGFDNKASYVVYAIQLQTYDMVVGEYTGQVVCEDFFPLFLNACIVDDEGVVHRLNGYSIKDGTFVFNADVDGTVVIYYDLVVPIIVVGVILLVALIIIIKVSSDKRKYKKAVAIMESAERQVNAITKNW